MSEPETTGMILEAPKPQTPALIPTTPMEMLAMAVSRGAGMDELQKFMDLQDRWEATEARKAFNRAFAAFKAEGVHILRTKQITDGPLKGKKHAELGEVVATVTPFLSKHGLSLSWRLTVDTPEWMEVTAVLRHVDGHSETVSMGGAPDTGPGRNAIQARGSAKTYLERYTGLGILGFAPEDDEDGTSPIPRDITAACEAIAKATTLDELQKVYTEAFRSTGHNKSSQTALITAKDKRKAEIMGATK